MPSIVQYQPGDPTNLFFSGRYDLGDEVVFETPTSFYWANTGQSGNTTVWGGGVVVEGTGFSYTGEALSSATKVTSLQVIGSYGPAIYYYSPAVTFSGLSLSAADTMALLQGNATRLNNIIAINRWHYEGSGGDDTFTSGDRADNLDGGAGADRLDGRGGNDVIQGGAGVDTVQGGQGDDKIDGGAGGGDLMFGGQGNDRFYVDSNTDRVWENRGEGYDSVYASDDFVLFLTASLELLSVSDPSLVATINLMGNDYSQKIVGGAGSNHLEGSGGKDVLEGRMGTDDLDGGAGRDLLAGGGGADTLTGGAEADTFVFKSLADSTMKASGRDTVMDFNSADGDAIDLHTIDANSKKGHNQPFDFIGNQAFHHVAGELRFEKTSTDTFVYGDVNGDGKSDFAIKLAGLIRPTDDDFLL